jgi:hypothetical protein
VARATLVAAALLASVLLAGAGCGLFEPRDSDPPVVSGGCRSLDNGWLSVAFSIIEYYGRVANETCYNALIDTAFVFHPDLQDVLQFQPGTFDNWDETVETKDNAQIASQQDYMAVTLLAEYQSPIISPDQSTEIHFPEYVIRFSSKSAPDTTTYGGLADITIHRGADGQWRVTDWVDHRQSAGGNQTWGVLRATYRTGF